MLDRIINIKPEYKYKEGKGSGFGFQKFFQTPGHNRSFFHDSISFSPAAVFLSRINWQLREINISSSEKLNLIFSDSDLEFNTEMDFLSFYSTPRQLYSITRDYIHPGKAIRLLLKISAKKNKLELNENLERMSLVNLEKLFDRIHALRIQGEIDKYDSSALRDLMDGIDEGIVEEFNYINTALFTLVSKIGNYNLQDNYRFDNERIEPIIIEKIAVING